MRSRNIPRNISADLHALRPKLAQYSRAFHAHGTGAATIARVRSKEQPACEEHSFRYHGRPYQIIADHVQETALHFFSSWTDPVPCVGEERSLLRSSSKSWTLNLHWPESQSCKIEPSIRIGKLQTLTSCVRLLVRHFAPSQITPWPSGIARFYTVHRVSSPGTPFVHRERACCSWDPT